MPTSSRVQYNILSHAPSHPSFLHPPTRPVINGYYYLGCEGGCRGSRRGAPDGPGAAADEHREGEGRRGRSAGSGGSGSKGPGRLRVPARRRTPVATAGRGHTSSAY